MDANSFRCLICHCRGTTAALDSDNLQAPSRSLIFKHLHVIFILRKILQIPSEKLANFLRECPDVEQWVRVCPSCDKIVSHCKRLYEQLLEIQKRFSNTQRSLVKIIKESDEGDRMKWKAVGDSDDSSMSWGEEEDTGFIVEECRRHVVSSEYKEWKDPFIQGDLIAWMEWHVKMDQGDLSEEAMSDDANSISLEEMKPDDGTPDTDEIVSVVLEMGEAMRDKEQDFAALVESDGVILEEIPVEGEEQPKTGILGDGGQEMGIREGEEIPGDSPVALDTCDEESSDSGLSFLDVALNNSEPLIGIEELEKLAQTLDINGDCIEEDEEGDTGLSETAVESVDPGVTPTTFLCPFCKEAFIVLGTGDHLPILDLCCHLDQCYGKCLQKNGTFKENAGDLYCPVCCLFTGSIQDIPRFANHLLFCYHRSQPPGEEGMDGGAKGGVSLQQRVFQCNLCRQKMKTNNFFNFDAFLDHCLDKHKKLKYKCTTCSHLLTSTDQSFEHWRNEHKLLLESLSIHELSSCYQKLRPSEWHQLQPEVPWWCPHCGAQFPQEDQRNSHVDTAHPETSLSDDNNLFAGTCSLCHRVYSILEELRVHRLMAHSAFDGEGENSKVPVTPSQSIYKN